MIQFDGITELLFGCLGTLLAVIGSRISHDLNRLTLSVEKLNERMASMIEKVHSHEKRLDTIEKALK